MTVVDALFGELFSSPDARRRTIEGVDPAVRARFEQLLAHAAREGMDPQITSVTRTPQEQAGSASQVSCSWHLFGRAMDLNLRQRMPEDYGELGLWWEALPPDEHGRGWWGGHWTNYGPHGDYEHFHWAPTVGAREACQAPGPAQIADPTEAAIVGWWLRVRHGTATKAERAARLGAGLILAGVGVVGLLYLIRRRKA